MTPKPGTKLYYLDRLFHVVGTLPDGDQTITVLKEWWRGKKRWNYTTITARLLAWHQERDLYTETSPKGMQASGVNESIN